MNTTADPHLTQPVVKQGASLEDAAAAMIMIHGRGAGIESILALTSHIGQPGFAFLAPQAAMHTWYPQRFIMPRMANEPFLSSALRKIKSVMQELRGAGIPPEKTMLLGFSQGACLALEYAARYPQRYGGVVSLSGGLIGAPSELSGYEGSLKGTPVFIGCSDVDFHIPVERVHESTELLTQQGASVTTRIYPGMGHTINTDEVEYVREMMAALV